MFPDLSGAFRDETHDSFALQGNGRAIALIHGFPGTPAEMRRVADLFHQHGWTARGILLPGFGKEIAQLPTVTKEDWLQTIATTITELQKDHDQIVLCGNSMGSALSLITTIRFKIDGLILFAPFLEIPHILWRSLPILKYLFPTIKPFNLFKPNFNDPEFRASLARFMPDADFDDAQVQTTIKALELPIRVFDEIRQVGRIARQQAPSITCPTLILQGSHDELVRPTMTRQLTGQFRGNVVYHELSAGHELVSDHEAWHDVQIVLKHFMDTKLVRS